MIQSFGNKGTKDIFRGKASKAARKVCPPELHENARRKLEQLDLATTLQDLVSGAKPLAGDMRGMHAMRINRQWRIIFRWNKGNPQIVEICDYH